MTGLIRRKKKAMDNNIVVYALKRILGWESRAVTLHCARRWQRSFKVSFKISSSETRIA